MTLFLKPHYRITPDIYPVLRPKVCITDTDLNTANSELYFANSSLNTKHWAILISVHKKLTFLLTNLHNFYILNNHFESLTQLLFPSLYIYNLILHLIFWIKNVCILFLQKKYTLIFTLFNFDVKNQQKKFLCLQL